MLAKIAREFIKQYLDGKHVKIPDNLKQKYKQKCGVFCTLYKNNELRGCIGLPYPKKSLIEALKESAISVCHDPRFPPLTKDELKHVEIQVSVLSKPKKVNVDQIKRGDGVILKYGHASALYLPEVWTHFKTKEEFLESLAIKAGLPPYIWKHAEYYVFSTKMYRE